MNFFEGFNRKFKTPLHLFNFVRAYDNIVMNKYYTQKIQSVKDLDDCNEFAKKYNCLLFLVELKNDLGMIAVIRQRNQKNYLFAEIIVNNGTDLHLFKTPICVN